MNSILNEITRLRKGKPLAIDRKNKNRYRIVTFESDGSKTAYYFSAPIYNNKSKKLIDKTFELHGNVAHLTGSNSKIIFSNNIQLENADGVCTISLANNTFNLINNSIICGKERIQPTTNGITIQSSCIDGKPFTFHIETNKPFLEVKSNNKYFAIMSEKFRPFFVISCIGTSDLNGNIISPAKISYQKISDSKYTITVTPCSSLGKFTLIEANLYELKLFQDTTVESNNSKSNNVFGSVGFIGNTVEFGEQWLYSKLDYTIIPELSDKKILHATLHLPKLNLNSAELRASKVSARFCSFGSNWENKISETSLQNDLQTIDHYINLDISPFITNKQNRLVQSDGFILKSKIKNSGFSVIATGDSYYLPQILEINYK
jgi:hypothetical protein